MSVEIKIWSAIIMAFATSSLASVMAYRTALLRLVIRRLLILCRVLVDVGGINNVEVDLEFMGTSCSSSSRLIVLIVLNNVFRRLLLELCREDVGDIKFEVDLLGLMGRTSCSSSSSSRLLPLLRGIGPTAVKNNNDFRRAADDRRGGTRVVVLAVEERDELLAVRDEQDGEDPGSLGDRPTARRRGVGGRSKRMAASLMVLRARVMASGDCPSPPGE